MKQFSLDPAMLTMGGVFYPKGYMFLMFPSKDAIHKAEQLLLDSGVSGETMSLVTPKDIQEKIAQTVGTADIPLPSAGSEADTVRQYAQLASEGHHALMVHAPDAADSDQIMDVLKDSGISYGQKYRMLVIEDLT